MGQKANETNTGLNKGPGGQAGGNPSTQPTSNKQPTGGGQQPTGGPKPTGEENVPRVVVVDVPEPAEPKKKRGPGRPPGSGSKQKKPAEKKTTTGSVDTKHLKILIKTVSDIIASKPNMQMWALSMEEIEAIEQPLSKVLERHAAVSEVAGEYGDYASLIIVVATIFIPKYLMWKAMQPKAEGVKENVRPRVSEPRNETGTLQKSSGPAASENPRPAATDSADFGGKLYQLVPTLM